MFRFALSWCCFWPFRPWYPTKRPDSQATCCRRPAAVALLAVIALLLSPYLLSAINPNEPQYVLPGAAYPPSPIASNDYYLLSAIY